MNFTPSNARFEESRYSPDNYNEESHKRSFLEVDVQYLEKLYEFYNDLLCLSKKKKKKKK